MAGLQELDAQQRVIVDHTPDAQHEVRAMRSSSARSGFEKPGDCGQTAADLLGLGGLLGQPGASVMPTSIAQLPM